ncbi:MAG: metallophosphoesterase [Alphaproteobacteria bacterium]
MTTIAHVSDLHPVPLPSPLVWPWRLKPVAGFVNAMRHHGGHEAGTQAATIAAVEASGADLVAATGDFIEFGLPVEIDATKRLFDRWGGPARVAFAPGNHDLYTTDAAPRWRAGMSDYFAGAAEPVEPSDLRPHYPTVHRVGLVTLITLCSGLPTWLFSAEGEVGAAQLARLEVILAGLDREATMPVVAVHHPPLVEDVKPLKRLRDAEALLGVLARHNIELVLHGHLHRHESRIVAYGGRSITLSGAPSGSATGRHDPAPAGITLVDVERGDEGFTWRITQTRTAA